MTALSFVRNEGQSRPVEAKARCIRWKRDRRLLSVRGRRG